MKKKLLCALLALTLMLLPLSGCTLFQNEVEEIGDEEAAPYYALAENFTNALFHEDYATCYALLAENLQNKMSADSLQENWEQVRLAYGDPVTVDARKPYKINGEYTIVAQVTHTHGGCSIQMTYDAEKGVAGLWFGEHDPKVSYTVAVPEGVVEEEIVLGEGTDTPLRAILTRPADAAAGEELPAVVLVQGSGASDCNEAIGGCAPFADIAHGLAQLGVASLRYDKRTYTYASTYTEEQINAMTVQEEVINDALLAVETLAKTPGIDADAIVLVGHSLGGMLAPRIAAQSGKVAGIVSLAGSARGYLDIVYDQNMAQTDDASQQNVIKKEYKKIDKLKNMKDSDTLFGIPVPYLKDLYAHPVEESLAQLDIPILVMQGENDFQMDTADYKSWQKALENYAGEKEFVLWPELNHLFVRDTAFKRRGTIAEYLQEGHVDQAVTDKIASWMLKIN